MEKSNKDWGKIGVLMGGYSSERNISLKSGEAILKALKEEGCDAVAIDITKKEDFKVSHQIEEAQIDLVFIALHGVLGEDGRVQSICEKLNLPYTGSPPQASRIAFNKALSQSLLKQYGLKVPSFMILKEQEWPSNSYLERELNGFPVVVKPSSEGSSIGISIVTKKDDFKMALEEAWSYSNEVLVEQFIEGREMTVGIVNGKPLPVIEICPKENFFNFKAKYTSGQTDYIVPAKISQTSADNLQSLALKAHRLLGCKDFSRVDFILDQNENCF